MIASFSRVILPLKNNRWLLATKSHSRGCKVLFREYGKGHNCYLPVSGESTCGVRYLALLEAPCAVKKIVPWTDGNEKVLTSNPAILSNLLEGSTKISKKQRLCFDTP
jgi:hypothetical protein